jgi:CRP/FNR family cyclic AMP-dependent transcriptional regulator
MDNDESMRAILAYCEGLPIVNLSEGEVLIAEGPASGHMYILISGEVEVLRGETQVADVTEPGAVFGEMAALLGSAHTATVRAVVASSAYYVEDAKNVLKTRPEMSYHVSTILARRLRDATSYLADIKRQFADRGDHLVMVDKVLDTLSQRQRPAVAAGARSRDSRT